MFLWYFETGSYCLIARLHRKSVIRTDNQINLVELSIQVRSFEEEYISPSISCWLLYLSSADWWLMLNPLDTPPYIRDRWSWISSMQPSTPHESGNNKRDRARSQTAGIRVGDIAEFRVQRHTDECCYHAETCFSLETCARGLLPQ